MPTDPIHSPARIKQVNSFRILDFGGGKRPTDIDGFLDFADKVFVFIDTKVEGVEMPGGQRLALGRLCDAARDPLCRRSLVLIGSHNTPLDEEIDTGACPVVELRHKGEWRGPKFDLTVREAVDLSLIGKKL